MVYRSRWKFALIVVSSSQVSSSTIWTLHLLFFYTSVSCVHRLTQIGEFTVRVGALCTRGTAPPARYLRARILVLCLDDASCARAQAARVQPRRVEVGGAGFFWRANEVHARGTARQGAWASTPQIVATSKEKIVRKPREFL